MNPNKNCSDRQHWFLDIENYCENLDSMLDTKDRFGLARVIVKINKTKRNEASKVSTNFNQNNNATKRKRFLLQVSPQTKDCLLA
jgi:hypothetical protein